MSLISPDSSLTTIELLSTPLNCFHIPSSFLGRTLNLPSFYLPSSYLLSTFFLPSFYLLPTHHFAFTKRIFRVINVPYKSMVLTTEKCKITKVKKGRPQRHENLPFFVVTILKPTICSTSSTLHQVCLVKYQHIQRRRSPSVPRSRHTSGKPPQPDWLECPWLRDKDRAQEAKETCRRQ